MFILISRPASNQSQTQRSICRSVVKEKIWKLVGQPRPNVKLPVTLSPSHSVYICQSSFMPVSSAIVYNSNCVNASLSHISTVTHCVSSSLCLHIQNLSWNQKSLFVYKGDHCIIILQFNICVLINLIFVILNYLILNFVLIICCNYQRWKVINYIYLRYCNWVAFLCTSTF